MITSITGLTTDGFYHLETPNWQAQSIGQDIINLFLLVPVLIISSVLSFQKRKGAFLVWGGVIGYLAYTFIIYCFALHFNRLFIVYCFVLGLSFYSICWFFYKQVTDPFRKEIFINIPRKTIGIYFIGLSVVFYFLWLAEILPAIIHKEVPVSLKETGLFTNAVQVLDLSIVLPGIFLTAILLMKKKLAGYVMAPVLLSFFILMDITIGSLVVIMKGRGLEGNFILVIIMGVLVFVSSFMLYSYMRNMR